MTNQKGFAHAFLIIGLIVALVGALGFVFWQNFMNKDAENAKDETTTSKKAESKQDDETTTYQPTIPNGWTIRKLDSLGVTFATSPDWSGEVSVAKYKPNENILAVNSGAYIYLRYSSSEHAWEQLFDKLDGNGPQLVENNLIKESTVKAEDKWPTYNYDSLHTGNSHSRVLVVQDNTIFQFKLADLADQADIDKFIKTISFE